MRILIVTGSSGGHIFPALSLLDILKQEYKDGVTLLIVPSKSSRPNIALEGYNVRYIPASGVRLRLDTRNIIAAAIFAKAIFNNLIILIKFRPDVVVGFGSIDSIPAVFLAWLMRIKTLIHEQNVTPGVANRLLSKFVDRVALSFPETEKDLDISCKRAALTGNPIRSQLEKVPRPKAMDFFKLKQDKLTILVAGGSQGSHSINISCLEALSQLNEKKGFQVIHLSGDKDYSLLEKRYKEMDIPVALSGFLQEMQYAYSAADLIICRAGATTIAELLYFHLPAIIIPYPFAYQHQLKNALVLENMKSAMVIEENEFMQERLTAALKNIIANSDRIKQMRLSYGDAVRENAGKLLLKEVLSL